MVRFHGRQMYLEKVSPFLLLFLKLQSNVMRVRMSGKDYQLFQYSN